MSTLAIIIPPRPRLSAGGAAAPAQGAGTPEYGYAYSSDGLTLAREGSAAPALLPRADQTVAVLAPADLSWHRIVCPRAPASRMAAALAGVLEEMLLEDSSQLHIALAPGAKGGETCWVAVAERAWLYGEVARLELAGLRIDRVVPSAWPDLPASGHFTEAQTSTGANASGLVLTWAHPEGVATWPLQGGLARALLPTALPADVRFTATPAVAAPAERWLGANVRVQSAAEHALQAARSLWNLRQFGFAPRHRGWGALHEAQRRFFGPGWRAARVGLAALAAVWLVGLNVEAWQQHSLLVAKRAQMSELLRSAHPQVRAVLDAPAQMQRETDALRVAAGRAGEADFESALRAAASAWPTPQPVQTLAWENGRLTLATPGWSPPQIAAFRDALTAGGWRVDAVDGRVTLSRLPGAAGRNA